eukprot:gene15288-16536_t
MFLATSGMSPGRKYRFKCRMHAGLERGWGPYALLRGVATDFAPAPGPPQRLAQGHGGISHSSCTLQWGLPIGLYDGATPNKYCLQYKMAAAADGSGGSGGGGGRSSNSSGSGSAEAGGSAAAGESGGGSRDSSWMVASDRISARAARKLHLQPSTKYLFRVRAHLAPAATAAIAAAASACGGGGWGEWSSTLSVTTSSLEASIKHLRRAATVALYAHTNVAAPPPLPTSTNGQQMPTFPQFIDPPRAVWELQRPTQASWLGGGGGARGGAVQANGRLGIFLRRSRLLEDSFDAMAAVPVVDWARGVVVHFAGENAMDYGALTRDWLVQTLEALANPAIALFTSVSSASLTHPSPASLVQPRYNEYFLLFGRLLGKAFLEDIPVTVRLSKLVLKALLGREDGALVDLEGFDAELHRNLVWMLDNDITDVIEETFCTTVSVLGKTETVDLVLHGRDKPVTQENKALFVQLKARVVMLHGIKEQMEHLRRGFTDLVRIDLKALAVADLHVALSGLSTISMHDWRKNTQLAPAFATAKSKHVIDMFWEIVGEMNPEQRSKLLYFATASASPPPGGFANLRPNRFTITAAPEAPPGSLPTAHSCFCELVLPLDIGGGGGDYDSFRHKLTLAIDECEGFGIV